MASEVGDPRTLSDESLWCRTERHLWLWERDTPVTNTGGRMTAYMRLSTCERCGATRTRTIDTTDWTVSHSVIRYPPGYLSSGGRLARAAVFREQFERPARRRAHATH